MNVKWNELMWPWYWVEWVHNNCLNVVDSILILWLNSLRWLNWLSLNLTSTSFQEIIIISYESTFHEGNRSDGHVMNAMMMRKCWKKMTNKIFGKSYFGRKESYHSDVISEYIIISNFLRIVIWMHFIHLINHFVLIIFT